MSLNDENLICGAGPIGLSCALFLHAKNIPCRIIEKETEISPLSRAILINSATLELFEESGISAKLIERGLKVRGFNIYREREHVFQVHFHSLPSKYNYGLALPQCHTEEILEKELLARGIDVERGCALEGFQREGEHIVAHVVGSGGREEITSKRLVGSDGIRSRVREAAGISFKGKKMKKPIYLFEVVVKTDKPLDELHIFYHRRYFSMFIPIHEGTFRLVSTLPHVDEANYPGMKVEEVLWDGSFRISSRLATQFRRGNVFLMGDAAHVHSPFGGKGMNNGIQDAYYFAKYLEEGSLGKYSKERKRVAAKLLKETKGATQIMMNTDIVSSLIRKYAMPNLLRIPGLANKLIARNMGLN